MLPALPPAPCAALPPALPLQAAVCSSVCNDSHLTYAADKGVYQRVGEATEVALRVLAEKVCDGSGVCGWGGRSGACGCVGRVSGEVGEIWIA